jgi:hypothetical protein
VLAEIGGSVFACLMAYSRAVTQFFHNAEHSCEIVQECCDSGRDGWERIIQENGAAHASKTVLRLPDLDRAKSAFLNRRTSTDARRGYRHAIEEMAPPVEWFRNYAN